jgi:hypothetical protein
LAGKLNTSSLSVTQNITGSLIISGTSTGAGGETLKLYGNVDGNALHIYSGSVQVTSPQGTGFFYSNLPITSSNLRINGTAVIKDLFVSGTWGGTGSGSLFVENSITASVISASNIIANSASFQYVMTVFETASVIFSSGSNQFGDELSDVQTLSGSVKVEGELLVNGVPVQTSSFDASEYLLTSSFNSYTESAASNTSASINSAVAPLLSTASFNSYTSSESSNVSASISASVASVSASLTLTDNEKLTTSSFNSYTASQTIVSESFNERINALETGSAPAGTVSSSAQIVELGFLETSSFNTFTESINTATASFAKT